MFVACTGTDPSEEERLQAEGHLKEFFAQADNGNGAVAQSAEIETVVEVSDDLTSQSRHSLILQGSPPSGKLLIPLARRDVRVVEGARLESVCRGNSTEGSNPSLSAIFVCSPIFAFFFGFLRPFVASCVG